MNEDKVLDFSNAYRKKHGEAPPIEGEFLKESIVNRLTQIPPKLAREFAERINLSLEEQLVYRNIILSSENPTLVAHLIDVLSENQLKRLKEIIVNLVMYTQKSMTNIANALLDVSGATPGSVFKAGRLFSLIEKMPEKKVEDIKEAIRLLGVLATTLTVYRMEDLRLFVEDRLSRMSEEELDNLIALAVRL